MKYNELWFEKVIRMEGKIDELLQMQDEVKISISDGVADFIRQDGYTVEKDENGLYTVSLV